MGKKKHRGNIEIRRYQLHACLEDISHTNTLLALQQRHFRYKIEAKKIFYVSPMTYVLFFNVIDNVIL